MSKPKTPTASSISRLLAAAGFKRADAKNSAMYIASGFTVGKHCGHAGAVRVRHQFLSMDISSERRRAQLERYASVIRLHGYSTEYNDYGDLIVTVRSDA